jgi:hypothetical protein
MQYNFLWTPSFEASNNSWGGSGVVISMAKLSLTKVSIREKDQFSECFTALILSPTVAVQRVYQFQWKF